MAHFRVAACLSFKASPVAQPFNGNGLCILMQIELISLTIVEHQDTSKPRQTATWKWSIGYSQQILYPEQETSFGGAKQTFSIPRDSTWPPRG